MQTLYDRFVIPTHASEGTLTIAVVGPRCSGKSSWCATILTGNYRAFDGCNDSVHNTTYNVLSNKVSIINVKIHDYSSQSPSNVETTIIHDSVNVMLIFFDSTRQLEHTNETRRWDSTSPTIVGIS